MINNKKMIFLSLLLAAVLSRVNADSLYDNAGDLVIESRKQIYNTRVNDDEINTSKLKPEEKATRLLITLSEEQGQEKIFKLFSKLKAADKERHSVFEPYALRELSLLCGSETSKSLSLFNKVDKTNTMYGASVLSALLSQPLIDKEQIIQRQNLIKLFLNDSQLSTKLEKNLMLLKNSQDQLVNFWNPSAELDRELEQRVFYPEELGEFVKGWNKSSTALQFRKRLLYFTAPIVPFSVVGYSLGAAYFFYESNFSKSSFFALAGLLNAYNTYKLYSELKLLKFLWSTIHTKMSAVSKTTKALKKIYKALKNKDQEISESLTKFSKLEDFVKKSDPQLNTLQELLNDSVFEEEIGWFSSEGKVLEAYKLMLEVKDLFLPALEAIGEIDAYLSITKVMSDHKDTHVHYSFVDFVHNSTPYIELKEAWNPLININEVITESVTLGEPVAKNIMLTGPHGGGKSTFMKSLAYNIILAQTFGIACASEAKLTIFHKINSYINIKEDLAEGQSTFMAEKLRVDQIKQTVMNLKPSELSFTVMDEVFKGTMEEEGSRRLYKFSKEIAEVPQNLCVIATHFKKPAEVEAETEGKFTNYHVGLIEQLDGSFARTFKIIKGSNEWWFNDFEKRERYIDWLTSLD